MIRILQSYFPLVHRVNVERSSLWHGSVVSRLYVVAIPMESVPNIKQRDVAVIQAAAQVRATYNNVITPGGVGAMAQYVATMNARIDRDEDKTKLADVVYILT
ncbi:hypothetical protein IFM89_004171 [Coptis chinensis]|uniref:SMP domain-containing protein n=1 Tax=Coptis chinensis TaxID=261450 RepID=A0A835LDH3_9MAGN|nr:hypothetical protein IFM89_004171 [Coptis chinensis]